MRVIDRRPQGRRSRRDRRPAARRSRPEGRAAAAGGRDGQRGRNSSMIAKFFIERPVLANVIAVLMVVIGAVALFNLPVAQYPDVVPPTVQVTTRYPGASARTVVDTVALPIEQQVNGVEDMLYMQSLQRLRRQLFADRHLQDRRRSQFRAGAGAEPRRRARCRNCRRRCRARASPSRRSRPRS